MLCYSKTVLKNGGKNRLNRSDFPVSIIFCHDDQKFQVVSARFINRKVPQQLALRYQVKTRQIKQGYNICNELVLHYCLSFSASQRPFILTTERSDI